MLRDITYERLPPLAYPLVNRFYKQAREKGKTQSSDEIYVARMGLPIIAAVRLCPLSDGGILLRSLAVLPEHRRTGMGTQFMKYVAEQIGPRECWCYPFSWLQAFYEQVEFYQIEPEGAPEFIQTPFENYQRQGRDIIIMAMNVRNNGQV